MKQTGFTLLETLLVFVIAMSLALLGLQTYLQFSFQGEINKASYNVNTLFQAARSYYYANCAANRDYSSSNQINTTTGQMDPTINTLSGTNLPIDITNNLINNGFLTNWVPAFSTVAKKYSVQFNLYNTAAGNVRNVQFCYGGTCGSVNTIATNNIYLWTIQVAIQVADVKNIMDFKNLMAADCISSMVGNIVTPCSNSPKAVDYLVFERLPSYISKDANSTMWLSEPNLKLFKRQYTNDEDYSVTSNSASYFAGYQNYLCGG